MRQRTKRIGIAVLLTLVAASVLIVSYGRCLLPEGQTTGHSPYNESVLEDLFKGGDAAIVARVTVIASPYRNHGCRLHLGGGYVHRVTSPGLITEIMLEVEEVFFADSAAYRGAPAIKVGSALRIVMYGDARRGLHQGADLGLPAWVKYQPIRQGERRVFFLAYRAFLFETEARGGIWTGGRGIASWSVTADEVAFPSSSEVVRDLRSDILPTMRRVLVAPDTVGVALTDLGATLRSIRTSKGIRRETRRGGT